MYYLQHTNLVKPHSTQNNIHNLHKIIHSQTKRFKAIHPKQKLHGTTKKKIYNHKTMNHTFYHIPNHAWFYTENKLQTKNTDIQQNINKQIKEPKQT